jgi:hypothetical protein
MIYTSLKVKKTKTDTIKREESVRRIPCFTILLASNPGINNPMT